MDFGGEGARAGVGVGGSKSHELKCTARKATTKANAPQMNAD